MAKGKNDIQIQDMDAPLMSVESNPYKQGLKKPNVKLVLDEQDLRK